MALGHPICPLIHYMFNTILKGIAVLCLFGSCAKSGYNETTVYNSNFTTGDATGIEGAIYYTFN